MDYNFEKKHNFITPAFCFNKSLHQQMQTCVSQCNAKSCYTYGCNATKRFAFSKAQCVLPRFIFEKKLHALVPKQIYAPHASPNYLRPVSDQKENINFKINNSYCSESLKVGAFNILLVKASPGTVVGTTAAQQLTYDEKAKHSTVGASQFKSVANKSCFNIISNVQIMVNTFGKTTFSKNFVNHFYSKHDLEYFKFKKLSGASIDVLNICCTKSQLAVPDNAFNKVLIKAQCSSLAGALFLKNERLAKTTVLTMDFAFDKHIAKKPLINKQLLANKAAHNRSHVRNEREQHVLETMKLVLGAFIITHKNMWFISANELKQCCLLMVNSEQNCCLLNAAPVSIVNQLKKSVNNSVVLCNKLLSQLIVLLNSYYLK